MLTALLLAAVAASTPQMLVTKFCAAYVRGDAGAAGVLDGRARVTMAPYLSKRLLRLLDDTKSCQQDWIRQQSTDYDEEDVPFGECCLFSSSSDGPPTSFKIGKSERMSDGRIRVVIHYELSNRNAAPIRWRDAAIVGREEGRYVIDDIVYDLDHEPTLLSKGNETVCRGGKWIGKF